MRLRHASTILAVALTSVGWTATYTVTSAANSGRGTLRAAIVAANGRIGPDTIEFAAALSGKALLIQTELPRIQDGGTTIEGDIDDDTVPDIALNGKKLATGYGLYLDGADSCMISGLAVVNFPEAGIRLANASGCTIRRCNLGISLGGTVARINGAKTVQGEDVEIQDSHNNTIGGTGRGQRNFFSGGSSAAGTDSLRIISSNGNKVIANFFGLARDATTALGLGRAPIVITYAGSVPSLGNTVSGNVFASCTGGVGVLNAQQTTITGNLFGLAADGATPRALRTDCITVASGSKDTIIGGSGAGEGNTFVSRYMGIMIGDAGTAGTTIRGNYFGTSADGTQQRLMPLGVFVHSSAGAQTIGGLKPGQGNHFALKGSGPLIAIVFGKAGTGSKVRGNQIGILPSGADSLPYDGAIHCEDASVLITDNLIARADFGLEARGSSRPSIFGNTFRHCLFAVRLTGSARASLGNLNNSRTSDDGGNIFRKTNVWFIENYTANRILAEGNQFPTTKKASIDAKIHDRLDDGSLGRVDFDPLMGGIHPSGGTDGVMVTGAAALPTAAGAEIVFSLSAPADVTVSILNIAGRPVATVVRDRASEAGMQRLLWSGKTLNGTTAPNGTYLVRIEARNASNARAQGLCSVGLAR